MKTLVRLTCTGLLAGSIAGASAQTSPYWVGAGASLNWSDTFNWSAAAVPTASDFAYLEDLNSTTGYTNFAGRVNNIVDSSLAVGTLYYTATASGVAGGTASHFYTTLIQNGATLTLGGQSAQKPAALAVGDVPGTGAWLNLSGPTNYSTITGPGSLVVSDPVSQIAVGMRNRATLDLSGLSFFQGNAGKVWVGVSTDNPYTGGVTGSLMLAKTNAITTPPNLSAPGVMLGFLTNATGTATVQLGQTNEMNTDVLVVGGRRGSATLQFAPAYQNSATPGSFKLRGSANGTTPVATLAIGDASASPAGFGTSFLGSSAISSGTADFSGGTVDIVADALYVGRGTPVNQAASGTGNGTLIVEQGTVSATNLYIAFKPPGTNASVGQGLVLLRSNAVMNVARDVALVFHTNNTTFISESRIAVSNNAVLNIGGNLTTTHTQGSWTPATVMLGGGTINMTGGGNVTVPSILGFGTVSGAGMVTVTNTLSIGAAAAPLKPAAPGTLLLGNNLTLGTNLPLNFKLGADTTAGGGVNDLIGVANNLTLNNNPLSVTFSAPLVTGTYLLLTNGGAQTGTATWVNPTRSAAALVQTATSVGIEVTSVSPASLVMAGSTPSTNWGLTNLVWNGNMEKFYQLDSVLFDDTATATNITVVANVTPGSIVVSNSTKPFALNTSSTGPAWFSGYGSLTKDGSGSLLINGVNNNFYGPVIIKQGTIKLGFANSGEQFGTQGATNPITILKGAAFDIANYIGSSSQYGRPLLIAGTGIGGTGALVCNNPTSGSSLTTAGITLMEDATIGCPTATRLTINGLIAPYNNALDLAGRVLTLSGTEVRFNQFTVTNAGTIAVNSSGLSLQNCILAGSGNIELGNKNLNFNNWSTGYVAKPVVINGGSISIASAGTPPIILGSPITLNGPVTITNSQAIRLTNSLTGVGSVTKYGTANLIIEAPNSYSGQTLVNAGRLVLSNNAALASPSIAISAGAGIDSTGLASGYTVAAGQTLQLDGTGYGDFTAGGGGVLRGSGAVTGLVIVASSGMLAAGTPVAAATLNLSSNLTFLGGTAAFKLGATTTPGGGINDLVIVGGNLDFSAPMSIQIDPVATLSGTYTLFQYSGSLLGSTNNITIVSAARYSYVLDTSVPGVVTLTVSGGAGDLTWRGGQPANPTLWDVRTTQNWLNGALPDFFYNGDSATFDDTALTNLVTLAATVKPAAMTFNNWLNPYRIEGTGGITAGSLTTAGNGGVTVANNGDNTFTGAGLVLNSGTLTLQQPNNTVLTAKLAGFGNLTKEGANQLTIVSADSSTFNGAMNINAGRVVVGSSNALGNGIATVANGASLDLNGRRVTTPTIHASGNGNDGKGALNNTGTAQTNAVRTLVLDGPTKLGAENARWDIAPADGQPASVQGNNQPLTKSGPADIWVSTGADTGLGAIDVAQGRLIFTANGTSFGDPASTITVRSGAALGFGGNLLTPSTKPSLIQSGGSFYVTGNNVYDGPVTMESGLIQMDSNASLNLNGDLTGTGTLQFRGTTIGAVGTLALSGKNTYTGGTVVNEGQLVILSDSALPLNTNVVLASRSAYNSSGHPYVQVGTNVTTPVSVLLDMQTFGSAGAAQATLGGDGGTWAGPIRITGANNNCVANFVSGIGGLNVNGAVDASGFIVGTSANGGIKVNGGMTHVTTLEGGAVTFNNPLIANAPFSIPNWQNLGGYMTKLVLNGTTNYWVSAFINAGIIAIGADNAVPVQAPITVRNQAVGADHRFVLDLNGHNQALASFEHGATGPFDQPVWFGNSSTNADSTISYVGTGTNLWSVFLVDMFNPAMLNPRKLGLTVTSGFLHFTNSQYAGVDPANPNIFPAGPAPAPLSNSYSGPTIVSGGTLRWEAVAPLTPFIVNGTGRLMGNGTIGSSLTVAAGGTVAPGYGVGTMTCLGALDMQPGSMGSFEVNAGTSACDAITGLANANLNGCTLIITNVGATGFSAGQSFKLFTAATYTVGPVSILPTVPGSGLAWDISSLGVDGTVRVIVQPAPPVVGGGVRLAGGTVGFTLTGIAGQPYTIRASSELTAPLATWPVIESGTLPQSSYLFTDPSATNTPKRFYNVSAP